MLFAVYDTETTGLTKHPLSPIEMQPRIIEFAGIITDGENILHALEFIVNPGIPIDSEITKITGLTNEDLEGKPDFSHYVPEVSEFFQRADAAIAHNLSFDKSMLRHDLERREMELSDINFPNIQICTVEQTMPEYGRRMKLVELHELLCGEMAQTHRAMDDIMMLHRICQKIGVYDAFKESAL